MEVFGPASNQLDYITLLFAFLLINYIWKDIWYVSGVCVRERVICVCAVEIWIYYRYSFYSYLFSVVRCKLQSISCHVNGRIAFYFSRRSPIDDFKKVIAKEKIKGKGKERGERREKKGTKDREEKTLLLFSSFNVTLKYMLKWTFFRWFEKKSAMQVIVFNVNESHILWEEAAFQPLFSRQIQLLHGKPYLPCIHY